MKYNQLDHTKSLYPHFFDKTNDSNFTKHLKIVGKAQQDIRHKLKAIEWSRILEKPLQLWKTQTLPYIYDMHFKVQVPYIKEVNIYKNPILTDDEEVIKTPIYDENDNLIGYEERIYHEEFPTDNVDYFEKTIKDINTEPYDYETDESIIKELKPMIPNDTYVLEVKTWDDYRFIKGYPENDYTVKEDNILQYRYNESFLDISVEEISYSKYLTFRVHKDKIKEIEIFKNNKSLFRQEFNIERVGKSYSTDFSYTYYDDEITNETTYLKGEHTHYYEIENSESNNIKLYFVDSDVDEYVYRLLLTSEDINDKGIVKDTYDLKVTTYESRYHCKNNDNRTYLKRYNGYDNELNDCFDHDYSLDIIGNMLNIHRFRFYQVPKEDSTYYDNTYPTWYNRSTEDDYHYMKRIQFYISNYNYIVFPVLEFWKYYTIFPRLNSRKSIIGEMGETYLRTSGEDYVCDTDFIDEDFEAESIISYSLNKATLTKGESHHIVRNSTETIDGEEVDIVYEWDEAIVVKDVYIVPSTSYRLRFGVDTADVNIRLICYNREGVELRTTSVVPSTSIYDDKLYNTTDNYEYTDTELTIPSDTVSVKIILECDNSFNFTDVSFERMTVVDFDNKYMATSTDYNSNFYELYADYEDVPKNIRMGGGERFDILLKRSLPLTKRGLLYMDINDYSSDEVYVGTNYNLYVDNIISNTSSVIDPNDVENEIYIEKVESIYLKEDMEYVLNVDFRMNELLEFETDTETSEITEINDKGETITSINYESVLVTEEPVNKTLGIQIEYFDENDSQIGEDTYENEIYSDTDTHITYAFTTPLNTSYLNIIIQSDILTTLENVKLSRVEELTIEEVT